MAVHNQVNLIGYLFKEPKIKYDEDEAVKIIITVRTIHREVSGYNGPDFENIVLYCDEPDLLKSMVNLKIYDVIMLKGIFMTLNTSKVSACSHCGKKNIKPNGVASYVYPISVLKIGSYAAEYDKDPEKPDRLLAKQYAEFSNEILIVGNVANTPQKLTLNNNKCICRYMVAMDRKYFISKQEDIKSDYPWVYAYGKQADNDAEHLKVGTLVQAQGFVRCERVSSHVTCSECGTAYTFPDIRTEIVPYAVEYLRDYTTDADITAMKQAAELKAALQ